MSVRGVTPYLIVDGAATAIDWYREVFAAEEVERMTGGAGRIAHAELCIGGTSVFIGDEHPAYESIVGPGKVGGTPVYLDVDRRRRRPPRPGRRRRCDLATSG